MLLIEGAEVVTPEGVWSPGWVLVVHRRIEAMGPGQAPAPPEGTERVDGEGLVAMPGFIDIHVHGGDGADTMDADPEALRTMARFHATHGVTAMIPTTWAAPEAELAKVMEAVVAATGPVKGGATILGVHLEGPWISPARAGAQDPAHIRPPDLDEALRLYANAPVRMVTVAPEEPGAHELIAGMAARRVEVSLGHTEASFEDMATAVRLGARHVTHTFNAMPPLGHRRPGALGAALTFPELQCEVIADNVHVHPAAVGLLARAKGPAGTVLVSDAIRAAGRPDGPVDLGGRVASCCGGAVRLEDGTLAGSALTLDVAVANFRAATGWSWPDVARAAAGNVADSFALFGKGRLVPGADADIVLLDSDGNVRMTVIVGRVVYRAD